MDLALKIAGYPTSLSLAMSALRRKVEIWILSRGTPEELITLTRLADEIRAGDYGPIRWIDGVTWSRIDHIFLDVRLRINYHNFTKNEIRGLKPLSPQELEGNLNELLHEYMLLGKRYRAYLARRFAVGLSYSLTQAYALHDPVYAIDLAITNYQQLSKRWGWDYAALRFKLLLFKLYGYSYIRGDIDRLPRKAHKQAWYIAGRFAQRYQAGYWYAESTAVAYVFAVLNGKSENVVDFLHDKLVDQYQKLNYLPTRIEEIESIANGSYDFHTFLLD